MILKYNFSFLYTYSKEEYGQIHSISLIKMVKNSNSDGNDIELNSNGEHNFDVGSDMEQGFYDPSNRSVTPSVHTNNTSNKHRKSMFSMRSGRSGSFAESNANTTHSMSKPTPRMQRKRRDSSFNYTTYLPQVFSDEDDRRSQSIKKRSMDTSENNRGIFDIESNRSSFMGPRRQRDNTIYNAQYQFEVIPSEMPQMSTRSSISSSSTGYSRNKRNGTITSKNERENQKQSMSSSNGLEDYDDEETIQDDDSVYGENKHYIPQQQVLLRPKQIHQNPLTPHVLPQGFAPINDWSRYKARYFKECLAEFLGTFILISLGDACSISTLLNEQNRINEYEDIINGLINTNADETTIATMGAMLKGMSKITQNYSITNQLGWAGSVVAGFWAAGGSSLSGAHLSWCVTLINFLFRGSPKFKLFFPYLISQLVGAYFAGLVLFGVFYPVILNVFPNWKHDRDFVGMFTTLPLKYLSSGRQFISEFIGSFYLIIGIFAMTDPYNNTSPEMFPVMLFIFIFTINATFALQTGAALNFSRDLGPRLALWTVGVDHHLLFDDNHHYFWVPMVAPLIGGLLGAFTYDLLIFRGQESWVNKPFYQNIASLRKKKRKVKKFFRRLIFRHTKYRYKKKKRDYEYDSDDETDDDSNTMTDFNGSDNDNYHTYADSKTSPHDEDDDIYSQNMEVFSAGDPLANEHNTRFANRRNTDEGMGDRVKFVDDNTSLNTTSSLSGDNETLDENENPDIGNNDHGNQVLNNIPEEHSIDSDMDVNSIEDNINHVYQDNAHSKSKTSVKSRSSKNKNSKNINDIKFNYYDSMPTKPQNVFRSYNTMHHGRNFDHQFPGRKKKHISFKPNKRTRSFVPTIEKEHEI